MRRFLFFIRLRNLSGAVEFILRIFLYCNLNSSVCRVLYLCMPGELSRVANYIQTPAQFIGDTYFYGLKYRSSCVEVKS